MTPSTVLTRRTALSMNARASSNDKRQQPYGYTQRVARRYQSRAALAGISDVSCCHVAFWSPATCAGWTLACESARLFRLPLLVSWNYHFWLALLVSTVCLSARAAGCESWMLFLMLSIYGLKQQYMVKTGGQASCLCSWPWRAAEGSRIWSAFQEPAA